MQMYFRTFLLSFLLIVFLPKLKAQLFQHPGILHSKEDLTRIKHGVAAKQEPIFSGYKVFLENPVSHYNYRMQGPLVSIGRNPTVGQVIYDTDANAAHQNAVMWTITGEKAYAEKAIEIVNAWASSLKSITGRDAVLMAGLGPFKMVNAAELLRYTNSGWKEKDIKQAELHFKTIIYPVLQNFALFANGNWDAAALKTVMAIGVFCNDRSIFERGLRYYVNGAGNGRLSHYVINNDGQVQESGRDQGHTQLGIAMLAECSAIAWNQGLDLYSYNDNLLLKGFEYTAKYNLGQPVPFKPTIDYTGKYRHKIVSKIDSGSLRAVYEQVYNHYVKKMGLVAPFTTLAAEKVRPEGPGKPGADHPGYGTLYFTVPTGKNIKSEIPVVPSAPGGLIVDGTSKAIALTWIKSIGATTYSVKRAEKVGGPYVTIAQNIKLQGYTDRKVKAGVTYFYTVTAKNKNGISSNALAVGISAGLPKPWSFHEIGQSAYKGYVGYDGEQFELVSSGKGLDSLKDAFSFTALPLQGDGEMTVRYVPQLSSQFSQLGLSIRSGTSENAAHVSLILFPKKAEHIEAPDWQARLLTRKSPGAKAELIGSVGDLPASAVTFGRLTGYYWLRLQRKGNTFSGYSSADGKIWTKVGTFTTPFEKNVSIGMCVASGLQDIKTTVQFDQVLLSF
ncbi:alginate lyase family protein [Pedobacter sp. MC2016-14]|uniref:alginate lyase family protein n=1 Tax=Pedobacter sp. MC2016-14 TaxID=2897327 RepID=UPI001E366611|nr:alginate lyase family protein [Pedobacter sp. MC2016-14]MCD0487637.1 alginate lyase family protein [Pedobacter sp. MC2016-14]